MSNKNMPKKSASDKPLFLRIVMLAVAAAMVLGLVIGTVAEAMSQM
ncbi:MAG: hypothetical protein ACI4JW_03735 [Oscillospiraceae bacterium]